MGSLRLLIADDHEIFRAGLRWLLELQPGWQVVAEASNGREAVTKAAETRPDVALMDIGMPVLNGLDAAHEIVQNGARTKIVMLTVYDSDAMIHKVLACGARGYVFKTDAARDLVNAVKAVQSRAKPCKAVQSRAKPGKAVQSRAKRQDLLHCQGRGNCLERF